MMTMKLRQPKSAFLSLPGLGKLGRTNRWRILTMGALFWASGASANCDANKCSYSNIPFTKAGFYVAQVRLEPGSQEGFWGLEANTSSGANTGGFNAGTVLKENGQEAGFVGFYLGASEQVNLTVQEYSGQVSNMRVVVEHQDLQTGQRTTVYGPSFMASGDSDRTARLSPGFYVASAASQDGDSRGRFGVELLGNSFTGGVNVGGWIDSFTGGNGEGFGAFYVASPQTVNLNLLFGNNYGTKGAGPLALTILYQDPVTGGREAYWSSNDNSSTTENNSNTDCQVDTTQAPEMAEYAKTTLSLCETYSPSIWKKLYQNTSSLEEVKIFFKRGLQAPGQTVGGVGIKSFIELSAEYLTQKPQEQNVVIHEMVHVAQSYSDANPIPPSWVIEGMADYVTHSLGFSYDWTHPTCQGGLHYTNGYWCGSAFFGFLEKNYDSDLVFKLNTAIKTNQYNHSWFESDTGKTLEQLWQECLQQDCVGGKTESFVSNGEFISTFKRVEYYKPTGYCPADRILVWLLFETSGVNTSNLQYVEEKSVYQTDPTNPYVEPIRALNAEGLVVRGFCAPPTLKSDFQVRLKQSSTGQLSNVMTFTVDVGSASVSQDAPPLNWLTR